MGCGWVRVRVGVCLAGHDQGLATAAPPLACSYGLEKLATEELCMHYDKDFGIACRIARFHNIYGAGAAPGCRGGAHTTHLRCHVLGVCTIPAQLARRCPPRPAGPYGTWKGGREKAPAAFCRKALTAEGEVEMWGDGKQTRSFTFIDDCVEGILRITKSDFRQPLNLGSCEMVRCEGGGVCVCVWGGGGCVRRVCRRRRRRAWARRPSSCGRAGSGRWKQTTPARWKQTTPAPPPASAAARCQ